MAFSLYLPAAPPCLLILSTRRRSSLSESLAATPPKCKTVASRAAAYKLLAALCKPNAGTALWRPKERDGGLGEGESDDAFDPSGNLRLLLEKGLQPLSKLLSKPDVWGYRCDFYPGGVDERMFHFVLLHGAYGRKSRGVYLHKAGLCVGGQRRPFLSEGRHVPAECEGKVTALQRLRDSAVLC